MDAGVRERLLALNPWFELPGEFMRHVGRLLPNPFFARHFDTSGFDDPRRVKLIVGPRQSGKSTLVWSLLRNREPGQVMYINAEEPGVASWCDSPAIMARDISREFPSVRIVFIDEVQRLSRSALTLKGLVDAAQGFNLIATGSSTYHLDDRVRESLAGRAERRLVLPFSLQEITQSEPEANPAVGAARTDRNLARMHVIGSYPAVWLAENPRHELSNLVEAFVLRDVSDRHRIERPDAFRTLMQLLAGQTGQMLNFAELAAHIGVAAKTARDYANILAESWIIRFLPPFAGGKRWEITGPSRIHFVDQGIRNSLLGQMSDDLMRRPDRGALFEGVVFGEILKSLPADWSIGYWRTKGGAEVDFVLRRGEHVIAVESKMGPRLTLSRSARSFIEAYRPGIFVMVTYLDSEPTETEVEHTRVVTIGLARLGAFLASECAGD
jgi:predicted AAA+ superfamily ATPase